ncbi:MAG: SsrA-binding protein [Candidatus Brennerbacteria bacterium RIFOXYC1_FULL_41_11]|uniref:SsrA-binding protein n=1 Tax=Candidatus Brennerbacteria bacterium RIFOXYD1_FULL_41_16 TaxID=1797529 RepID=A0A1G1XL75_9BACT|nr:MAG: SsrA-binding protein [Candidatus Brennerbacteria bacterium RIFOXYB1_FULL_41_13]OGY39947.1 MAG: SsrA-binding protein [Candidatus Brennerbacteria bacterium RIFOXYC1_FULL_41_11]OGY40758.1 MAG: SsrA-binding protein [Candidatus Brennerbacteria bacterium RIFOXYD1_FULL_41_16]
MSILSENKKARFDYEILDIFEAGLVLSGIEAKSAKKNRIDLTDSFVRINAGDQIVLVNAKIHPFQPENAPKDYKISRTRQLLLKKKEIKTLLGKLKEKKLTAVPLRVYTERNLVKLSIAVAKSKRQHEKREVLRKRAVDREIERTLTNKNFK